MLIIRATSLGWFSKILPNQVKFYLANGEKFGKPYWIRRFWLHVFDEVGENT